MTSILQRHKEQDLDVEDTPKLRSPADVRMFEAFDIDNGAFLRCFYTYFDTDHHAWIGQHTQLRKYDLSLEDIALSLRRIPDEKAFPIAPQQITQAPVVDLTKHFLKRPQIHCLSDAFESTLVPRMHIEEAETLEYLKKHPHPNIVPYYGCVLKRGRIVGIVLKRFPKTLEHRLQDDTASLNIETLERQLRSAINHIHALGLAHNDLNPSNLALDELDHLAIIDWGSCRKFGEDLTSAGTPGWIDEEYETSDKGHDLIAIQKVLRWVREKQGTAVNEQSRVAV